MDKWVRISYTRPSYTYDNQITSRVEHTKSKCSKCLAIHKFYFMIWEGTSRLQSHANDCLVYSLFNFGLFKCVNCSSETCFTSKKKCKMQMQNPKFGWLPFSFRQQCFTLPTQTNQSNQTKNLGLRLFTCNCWPKCSVSILSAFSVFPICKGSREEAHTVT